MLMALLVRHRENEAPDRQRGAQRKAADVDSVAAREAAVRHGLAQMQVNDR